MKTSIFAMMIAATMVIASCGQKKTEEETSAPIETIIEETPEAPVMEEIPSEEVIEGEVLEITAEETPAVVSEN